jgi:hypothetical protein
MVWCWLTVIVVRKGLDMATYVFGTDLYVGADSLEEARDGLLELLAEIVRRNDGDAFYVKEMIYEEDA